MPKALPFAVGGFSHVLASDLLEHTRSPTAAIESAGAALQPGGPLVRLFEQFTVDRAAPGDRCVGRPA